MCYLSAIDFGSNLGDSQSILTQAVETLKQSHRIKLIALSSWYRTLGRRGGGAEEQGSGGSMILPVRV